MICLRILMTYLFTPLSNFHSLLLRTIFDQEEIFLQWQNKMKITWCQVRAIRRMHTNFPTKYPKFQTSHYRIDVCGLALFCWNTTSFILANSGRFWSIAHFMSSNLILTFLLLTVEIRIILWPKCIRTVWPYGSGL